jgi:hypothetical protein
MWSGSKVAPVFEHCVRYGRAFDPDPTQSGGLTAVPRGPAVCHKLLGTPSLRAQGPHFYDLPTAFRDDHALARASLLQVCAQMRLEIAYADGGHDASSCPSNTEIVTGQNRIHQKVMREYVK